VSPSPHEFCDRSLDDGVDGGKFTVTAQLAKRLEDYNALRDEALAEFFAHPETRKLLLHTGVIAEDGRIVALNRAFARVIVAERNTDLAEKDEAKRREEAAFLKAKLRHRVKMQNEQTARKERVQHLRAIELERLRARHEAQDALMVKAGVKRAAAPSDEAAKDSDPPAAKQDAADASKQSPSIRSESLRVDDDELATPPSSRATSSPSPEQRRSPSPAGSAAVSHRSSSAASSRHSRVPTPSSAATTPSKKASDAGEASDADAGYSDEDFESPPASPRTDE